MDLWPPTFATSNKRSPNVILTQQASILGGKTRNWVTAEVRALESLRYEFAIVAQALGFREPIFTISYEWSLYPVNITLKLKNLHKDLAQLKPERSFNDNDYSLSAKNENDFVQCLESIFHSQSVGNLISALSSERDNL